MLSMIASSAWAETSNVDWTNGRQVAVAGSNVTKSTGGAAWNAGASATKALTSGAGYFVFTAATANASYAAGLSESDLSLDPSDLSYSIQLSAAGTVAVYESGVSRGTFGSYVAGDSFRIDVAAGVATYSRNGVLFYTSGVAVKYPLQPDVSLFSPGASIADAVVSGTLSEIVSWAGSAGVASTANNLTKTSTAVGYNAGAVSTRAISSGDGSMELTAKTTSGGFAIGLGTGDSGAGYADIEFAFLLNGASLTIYESGVSKGSFGSYVAGDHLRVAVESGVVLSLIHI